MPKKRLSTEPIIGLRKQLLAAGRKQWAEKTGRRLEPDKEVLKSVLQNNGSMPSGQGIGLRPSNSGAPANGDPSTSLWAFRTRS